MCGYMVRRHEKEIPRTSSVKIKLIININCKRNLTPFSNLHPPFLTSDMFTFWFLWHSWQRIFNWLQRALKICKLFNHLSSMACISIQRNVHNTPVLLRFIEDALSVSMTFTVHCTNWIEYASTETKTACIEERHEVFVWLVYYSGILLIV